MMRFVVLLTSCDLILFFFIIKTYMIYLVLLNCGNLAVKANAPIAKEIFFINLSKFGFIWEVC